MLEYVERVKDSCEQAPISIQVKPTHVCQERLDDPALAGHIVDHGHHVIARPSDQRRTKHDGEVARLHLVVVTV